MVNLFTCWLLLNRIPTKDNLFKRGELHSNDQQCIRGCGMFEDVDHLCVMCESFGRIWYLITKWLGFVTITSGNIVDHRILFECIRGFSSTFVSSFGSLVCRSFEKKGTCIFFEIERKIWNCHVTKLSFSITGGWKRDMQVSFSTTIIGGGLVLFDV